MELIATRSTAGRIVSFFMQILIKSEVIPRKTGKTHKNTCEILASVEPPWPPNKKLQNSRKRGVFSFFPIFYQSNIALNALFIFQLKNAILQGDDDVETCSWMDESDTPRKIRFFTTFFLRKKHGFH